MGVEMKSMVHAPSRLVSIANVAEALAVSVATVRRLCDAGKMPAPVSRGRLLRWRADEIDAWIRAGCPVRSIWEASKRA